MFVLGLFISLLCFCTFGQTSRILGVVPIPSYSHQIVFRPIWNELARRGHDVVVITTDPQNNPDLNITEIDVRFLYDVWTKKLQFIKLMERYASSPLKLAELFVNSTAVLNSELFSNEDVQKLLKNETEYFDLVLVEYAFPVFPPALGFTWRFKSPYIGIMSLDFPGTMHSIFGNPSHPLAFPDIFGVGVSDDMNFWDRFVNAAAYISYYLLSECLIVQDGTLITNVMKQYFGQDVPSLRELVKNASMIFINENPAFNLRPLGPSFVLIGGGTHLTPPKELPKNLKEYLDGAKDGFIYFSLGTNVKSDTFLPEQRKIVLDAFRELPYRVLWKFDITDIPDVPENVKIQTWLPQNDILRHPNIKVFITQGGLQSIEETIFSHVPIVGIPYVADQQGNVKKLVSRGGGVYLDKAKLSKEYLKEAVLEVITNPKYKESITEIAELSRDQPMSGIEKAIWWTEYVIRHKGARHLRSPVLDIPSYQYYFLDVIAFSLFSISVILFIIYKLVLFVVRLVVRKFFSKKIKSN